MIRSLHSTVVVAPAPRQSPRPADRVAIGIVMLAAIVGTQFVAWLTM
jgi:hypothetical protein